MAQLDLLDLLGKRVFKVSADLPGLMDLLDNEVQCYTIQINTMLYY